MDNKGQVSVIVPMYNQELYIEKCIECLIAQSYRDFEVLIVDDGSTDNSAKLIKKYLVADKRVQYLYKQNGGLSSARNYGLERASGEYVCFIDPDDYVQSKYLEELLIHMDDEIDIVIGKFTLEDTICSRTYIPNENEHTDKKFVDEEKIKSIVLPLAGPCGVREIDIFNQTFMPVWKNIYRKAFLERNSLFFISEREIMFEDYLFNIKAYYSARAIYLCDSFQYVHCLRQNSLSRRYRENYFSMIQCMYTHINNWICEIDYGSQAIRIRNSRMETKWILDVMYNMTYAKSKGLYSRIKDVVHSDFAKRLLSEVDKFELPFYYRFLYFLLKNKQTMLLVFTLTMFRRMEKIYRLYKDWRDKNG